MGHPTPSGPPAAIGRWPVTSDPGPVSRRGVRADPVSAVFLMLSGLAALVTWFVSSYPVGNPLISQSGSKTYHDLRGLVDSSVSYELTALGMLAVTVCGGALVLLAAAVMLPVNHRPLAAAAMMLSVILTAVALWLLVKGREVVNIEAAELLSLDHPAWFLIAGAAILGWVGGVRALVVG